MAGFNIGVSGNFFLPRASMEPPEFLRQALWPWVNTWLA
jgi:hypothetical protein